MKKVFFSVFLSIIMAAPVFAADWVQIDEKRYLDDSSLSKYNYNLNFDNDKIYSIWSKFLNDGTQIWKELEKIIGKKLWYDKTLWVVNCTKKELAIKKSVYYDLKGNVADNSDDSYLDWSSVTPETLGETIYLYVCGGGISNTQNNTIFSKSGNYIQSTNGTRIKVRSHR